MNKELSVEVLQRVLALLLPTDTLVVNAVGNMIVMRNATYYGYVDFLEGTLEIV